LLNKIDCTSLLKDKKIETVHDLLEQQQALCVVLMYLAIPSADCTKSHEHEALATNGDVIIISNAFCIKQRTDQTDATMVFMRSIF